MLDNYNFKQIAPWLKFNKIHLILFFIILVGAYLRLSDFSDLARFNADQVRDAGIIDAMRNGEGFPLLGPKAGGTTFKLGPAFYYLEYFSSFVFGNDPAGIAVIVPIFSVASIYLFFLLFKFFFTPQTSLLLTFLYATSFYTIRYARFAWNPNVIPFFLLAFLLLLIKIANPKTKKIVFYYLALGTIIGIGMQLHTTMLLLMPTVFLLTCANIFRCKKKLIGWHILATITIAALLYSPAFLYDLRNSGKNLESFFSGTSTKTEEVSLVKNIALDAQYFIQGSAYVISGIEPQKNWTKISKLLMSKNPIEISLAIFGTIFFCFGGFLLIKRMRNLRNEDEKNFIFPVASLTVVSFLLFFLIANELNLRFFISLIFLPFLFFGVIIEFLKEKIKNKNVMIGIIASIVIILSFTNIYTYRQTYNLSNYTARESAYGGISLGETEKLTDFIRNNLSNNVKYDRQLLISDFSGSIQYLAELKGIKLEKFSNAKASSRSIIFLVSSNENERFADNNDYREIAKEKIGRFFISALIPSEDFCKIGFITDIHASYSKSSQDIIRKESSGPLSNFINEMNNSFHPDFVIQGGDLIDGREKSSEIANNVFASALKHFSKLEAPTIHMMGNHETRTRGITKESWLKQTGNNETYYFRDCKNTRIIILDGMEMSNEYYYALSEKQLDWLTKTLRSSKNRTLAVFIHEPLVMRSEISSRLKPEREFMPEQTKRIKTLLSENNASMIVSGHVEALYRKMENKLIHQTFPGIFKSKDEEIAWLDSFAEITIGENVGVDFYYKKDRSEKTYRTIKIPSEEFDRIEK